MKTLFKYIVCLATLLVAMQSCQMIEDDVFDVDPATRQDNWMAEYRRVFNNNQYGWALYTDNPTYGRHPAVYAYAVRFDSINCTFYKSSATRYLPNLSEVDSVVSQYSFKMDNGIVLSFDTYNDFFHYYADQSEYFSQDLQSDFEFCLDRFSANEDTIHGRGKTKQLPFFMVKMQVPATEYQALADEVGEYAPYDCVMICEGDTMQAKFLSGYKNLCVYYPDEEGGDDVEHMYSYGTLTTGIYLLENFEYKGTTVVEMNLDKASGTYTDVNGKAKIAPKPLVDYILKSDDYDQWFFGYSGLGSWTKGQWDLAKDAFNAAGHMTADDLHYIGFVPDGQGGMQLLINKWFGSGEIYYDLELRKVSDDEFAVRYTGKETTGMGHSPYADGLSYIVDAFAKTDSWTTYKITFKEGNPMSPSGIVWTDESNPDNSIYFETNFRYNHYSIWE